MERWDFWKSRLSEEAAKLDPDIDGDTIARVAEALRCMEAAEARAASDVQCDTQQADGAH